MLSDRARVLALEDLWSRLEWVHRTDPDRARSIGCTHTPFYALTPRAAAEQVDELARRNIIDSQTEGAVKGLLDLLFAAIRDEDRVLNHSDAGLHNTLWDGARAIPIDFEFACLAPRDLDLELLFRQLSANGTAFQRLRELADGHLRRQGSRDRLVGYALLRDLWALRLWLHYADSYGRGRTWPPQEIGEWDPWRRVIEHSRNEGHLIELWA